MTSSTCRIPVEGEVVHVEGYEFTATRVRICLGPTGSRFVRFTGICTDDPRNDLIRNTSYNGGTYGWGID